MQLFLHKVVDISAFTVYNNTGTAILRLKYCNKIERDNNLHKLDYRTLFIILSCIYTAYCIFIRKIY